jgi:hypothetical protein
LSMPTRSSWLLFWVARLVLIQVLFSPWIIENASSEERFFDLLNNRSMWTSQVCLGFSRQQ